MGGVEPARGHPARRERGLHPVHGADRTGKDAQLRRADHGQVHVRGQELRDLVRARRDGRHGPRASRSIIEARCATRRSASGRVSTPARVAATYSPSE